MFWILLGVLAIFLIYWFLLKPYRFWLDRDVPQKKPLPFFGHTISTVFKRMSFPDFVEYVYNMFPNCRYFGFYQFFTPILLIRDPDLIKQITVKDFDHFTDHMSFVPEDADPLWSRGLLSLKGEKWRQMRSTLSPSFTSSKMKGMFVLISECAENFTQHFLEKDDKINTVDVKDITTRFTNDVIATVAFGIECDSLKNRDNDFYVMGKEATDLNTLWKSIKFLITVFLPKLAGLFGLGLFSKRVSKFFTNLIKETIKIRDEQGIVRPDMLHLLMEARYGKATVEETTNLPDTGFATVKEYIVAHEEQKKSILTDLDIAAQAILFFFAGFDSVSNLMCFMSYEIAVQPEIQQRLQKEIDETSKACGGKLTYEALLKMKYLDMVISETLRKWPNTLVIDRVCCKQYTIQPNTEAEKPVTLKVGQLIWIPVMGLHKDETFYPNPDKFDPERFSDENKSSINFYSYLPFGTGPRNCIGSRFALLEAKLLFYHLLSSFSLRVVEETQVPLKLSKMQFTLSPEKKIWLGMKSRHSK